MHDTGDPGAGERGPLSKREFLSAGGAVGASLLGGCLGGGTSQGGDSDDGTTPTTEPMDEDSDAGMETTEPMDDGSGTSPSWRSIELSPVRGEETFTIDSLDAPVVIQSFAVWCPKCQRQSERFAKLDDSITPVSLDTDPNEDAEKVRKHAEDNGFDWRFAVAPTEMTKALVDEFGTTVTNAPSTPVIVACEAGVADFFSGSINSAGQIESAAETC